MNKKVVTKESNKTREQDVEKRANNIEGIIINLKYFNNNNNKNNNKTNKHTKNK